MHSAGDAPDSALAISRHLAATRFEDLPAATVAATKASILDTIGCAVAGGSGPDVAACRPAQWWAAAG